MLQTVKLPQRKPEIVSRKNVPPSRLLSTMMANVMPDVREPALARNEGHPIELVHQMVGQDGMSIGMDISKAPVPARRYLADVCSVTVNDGHLRILFAQRALGPEDALDSALVLRFAPHAAHHFVGMIERMARPGLDGIAANMGISPQPLLDSVSRPTQVGHMAANMAAVGVSGFESCLDFYHASPFSMRNIESKKQLGVEPVVRVDLSTALLVSLVERAKELVKDLPAPPSPEGTS